MLWVHDLACAQDVCQAAGISAKTLARWRRKHGWDAQRGQQPAPWGELRGPLRGAVATLIGRLEATKPAAAAQAASTLKALLASADLLRRMDEEREHRRQTLRICEGLAEFIMERDPKVAGMLAPHLRQFAQRVTLGRPDHP